MRPVSMIACGLCLAAVAACNKKPPEVPVERPGANQPHSAWIYSQSGTAAHITSGAGATPGQIQLDMNCRKGDRNVQMVFTNVRSEVVGKFDVVLSSGGQTQHFPGEIAPTQIGGSGGAAVIATVPIDAPVLLAFAKTGKMTYDRREGPLPLTVSGAQLSGVQRLLDYCLGRIDLPRPAPLPKT